MFHGPTKMVSNKKKRYRIGVGLWVIIFHILWREYFSICILCTYIFVLFHGMAWYTRELTWLAVRNLSDDVWLSTNATSLQLELTVARSWAVPARTVLCHFHHGANHSSPTFFSTSVGKDADQIQPYGLCGGTPPHRVFNFWTGGECKSWKNIETSIKFCTVCLRFLKLWWTAWL